MVRFRLEVAAVSGTDVALVPWSDVNLVSSVDAAISWIVVRLWTGSGFGSHAQHREVEGARDFRHRLLFLRNRLVE